MHFLYIEGFFFMGHRVVMDHPGTDLLKGSKVFQTQEAGRQAVSQLGHSILINRLKGWSMNVGVEENQMKVKASILGKLQSDSFSACQSMTGTISIL